MQFTKTISGFILTALLVLLAGSCSLKSTHIEPYMISIDSVAAPDTVRVKTLFNINLYGYVGPNKCYADEKSYSYINEKNEFIIEAWGKYSYVGKVCEDGVVLMDATVETSCPTAGTYVIKGTQPSGYFVEKTIIAE